MSTTIQLAPRRRKRNNKKIILTAPSSSRTQANRVRRQRKRARVRAAKNIDASLARDGINTKIAKCTVEYAQALVNPFGARQTNPCIPDSIVMPSLKYQTKARGTFYSGTNGCGFVLFDPWHMMWNDGSIAGNAPSAPILFTGVNYAGISSVNWELVEGDLPTGVFIANCNSPYSAGDFATGNRQVRLVAAGLRVTYTGSNLRNQGQLFLGRSQANDSFPTTFPLSEFSADNYTSIVPVSRKSEYTFYTPDNHDLLSYNAPSSFDENDPDGTNHFAYLIAVDGGDTTQPQAWYFEAVAYFELIGRGLTLSPSHSDVQGMGHVHEALPVRNPVNTPKVVENNTFTKIANSLKSSFVSVLPQLTRAGMGVAASYLTGSPVPAMASLTNAMQSVTITEAD